MITIDVQANDNTVIIRGKLDWSIKDAIKRQYRSNITENGLVINFDSTDDLEQAIVNIEEMFKRRSISADHTDSFNKKFEEVMSEQKRFDDFSKKALRIRNLDYDIDDFQEFEEKISSSMVRCLYPLQLVSSFHLAFSQNSCNFSVPGAGKTSIVYASYAFLKEHSDALKRIDRMVIVGPLSSFGPWESEFEACFGRKPIVKRLDGSVPQVDRVRYLFSKNPAELTLISYGSLPGLKDEELEAFLRNGNVMIVLDEAHRIKNTEVDAVHAQSVMRLSKHCKSRVVLTGTPIPNGYEDLYNLFKFIWPYHDVIGFSPSSLKQMTALGGFNEGAVQNLLRRIEPYFIRIKKSDLNLPPAIVNRVSVTMGPIQRKIYDYVEQRCMKSIQSTSFSANLRDIIASARMIRMMQAASNPNLLNKLLRDTVFDGSFSEFGSDEELIDDAEMVKMIKEYCSSEVPAKFNEAAKIIKEKIAAGQKVVVWAYFIDTIDRFCDHLLSIGIFAEKLDGRVRVGSDGDDYYFDQDIKTREKIISEFNDPLSKLKVIVANPQAVGESISLHKTCHNAVYIERNYNAGLLMQSKDRIHRYGLPSDVITNYYYLISDQSIENSIDTRLEEKESRMNEIIEKEEIPLLKNVLEEGDEDIKRLIADYVNRFKKV